MGDVIAFSEPFDMRASTRMARLLGMRAGGATATELGTSEEWGWTAAFYLGMKISEAVARGNETVEVSTSSISFVLTFLEDLASRRGIILPPDGPEAL